jgi:hypothetical protein
MSEDSIDKWMEMMMRKPLQRMEAAIDRATERINELIASDSHTVDLGDIKEYMMFSGHDTTVLPLWEFLESTNIHLDAIPYASQIQLKLVAGQECLQNIVSRPN